MSLKIEPAVRSGERAVLIVLALGNVTVPALVTEVCLTIPAKKFAAVSVWS